jgi:hypothetical protein
MEYVWGVLICIVCPTLYTAGIWYLAKKGLPFKLVWRGEDDE